MAENMWCRKCESTNIIKAGKRTDGRQVYKCKDCSSHFMWELKKTQGPLTPISKDITCRSCKGTNLIRAGKRPDGRQIYKCKDCESCFVWDVKRNKNPINGDIECRSCNSTNLVRSGKTADGRQIYKCKDCGYRMTWLAAGNTAPRKTYTKTKKTDIPQEISCKKCGSRESLVKTGKRQDGRQRYKCQKCVYAFTWDVKKRGWKSVEIPEEVTCIYCGKRHNLIGRGKQADGKQIYYCKECNKSFTETVKKKTKSVIPEGTLCKQCGGERLIKVGTTTSGVLRVRCKDCNISFSLNDKNKPPLPEGIYCTRCDSTNITTRGQERGNRMFQCKDCKYRFMWKNN